MVTQVAAYEMSPCIGNNKSIGNNIVISQVVNRLLGTKKIEHNQHEGKLYPKDNRVQL